MWCGKCYISDPKVTFHIKEKEDFGVKEGKEAEQERIERAWGAKHRSPDEYMVGRDGDHFLISFECDFCIFRKLRRHSHLDTSDQDKLLLGCIRRISLDVFWSRASSTVRANRDKIKQGLELSKLVGLDGSYHHIGSMP
jgi:hypothetical protein